LTVLFAMLVLGLAFTGAPLAQTQTTTSVDVRHFEVIAVDGNRIVVRDERGTNEYDVPADFRFTVDGKQMAASELKPGMKGTATVTTTTTITPVVVTEIRKGIVLQATAHSVTVLDDTDRMRKRFTQEQLNERGLKIYKDGRSVLVSQLDKGDAITATIVSQHPPAIVTEQEVNASLAQAEPAPAKTESAAPVVVAQATTPPATTPPATTPPATAAAPAPAPAESSGIGTLWIVIIALVIAAVLYFVMRQRKDGQASR